MKLADFNEILLDISTFASFKLSKEAIQKQVIDYNPLQIKRNNEELKEAYKIIADGNHCFFSEFNNLESIITKLKNKSFLQKDELINLYKHNINILKILKLFHNKEIDLLNDYISNIVYDKEYIHLFERIFDSNYIIKKDASEKLAYLNKEINTLTLIINNSALKFINQNENIIHENNIYERDGRYCLLIKPTYKNSLKGLIHGETSSGLGIYFEPNILVSLNNELLNLKKAKEEELFHLLKSLSKYLFNNNLFYKDNIELIIKLDVVMAKARYTLNNNLCIAEFNKEKEIKLKAAYYPLIKKEIVYNDYHLGKDIIGIVISGSNTGGKTIALKIMALAHMMAYIGCGVFASKANLALFNEIMFLIDESQSVKESLSTFSASLKKLNYIMKNADHNSFILIDELGNGTDPSEGESLALAFSEYLVNNSYKFIMTTHFTKVKDYAFNNPKILLSSVEFDKDNLKPTYRYLENNYGYSNSLEIAKFYLDDLEFIKQIEKQLNEDKLSQNKVIMELNKLRSELEEEKIAINQEKELFEVEKNKFIAERNKYNPIIIKAIEDKLFDFNDFLEKQKEEVIQINDKKKKYKAIEENKIDLIKKEEININLGDKVRIISSGVIGEVIKKNNNKITVASKNLNFNLDIDKVQKINEIKEKKYQRKESEFIAKPKDLNVIGLNSKEALEKLAKYIDDLIRAKVHYGHVIHGVGSGVLRNSIHQFLKKDHKIKSFNIAPPFKGGYGATEIVLK